MTPFLFSPNLLTRCALLAALTAAETGCGGGGAAETTATGAMAVAATTVDTAAVAATAQAVVAVSATVQAPAAEPTTASASSAATAASVASSLPVDTGVSPLDATTPATTALSTDIAAAAPSDEPVLLDFVTDPGPAMATIQSASNSVQIQAADVIFNVNSASSLASRGGQLQCLGTGRDLSSISTAVNGPNGSGGSELKYGWVQDPALTIRKAVTYFAVRNTDVDTAGTGNKRCENAFYGNGQSIPWDKEFWFTTAVRTGSMAGTTDQQALWQWHEMSGTAGLSPYLAAYVSGTQLVIQSRSNQNSTMTQANTAISYLYTINNWAPNTWYQFTVQAKLDSKNNGASYVRIWLNGVLVVNRVGPLGYKYANPQDYVKNGIYHWTNGGNTWQTQAPKREAWFKGPAMVLDRSGYTADVISALIK